MVVVPSLQEKGSLNNLDCFVCPARDNLVFWSCHLSGADPMLPTRTSLFWEKCPQSSAATLPGIFPFRLARELFARSRNEHSSHSHPRKRPLKEKSRDKGLRLSEVRHISVNRRDSIDNCLTLNNFEAEYVIKVCG